MDDLEPSYEYSATGFPVNRPIQYFGLAFRSPNTIRLVNVDQHIASCVQEKVEQLLPVEKSGYVCFSDYHTGFTGRFNIYDLVLEKPFFKGETAVGKEDATLIRVVLCRVLGALYCIGYDVLICSDVARTRTNGTIFLKLRDPVVEVVASHYYSHKFVCVAPYSTDTLLLINIPKTMLDKVIKVIHLTWSPGVKSKQTLADDNRSVSVITSLKIHGHPWSQAVYNSGKASVQARLVLLEVIKIFAENNWRLAANINLESTADSLLFQWCPSLDMEEWRFCAVSLNRYDRLRLLRTPGPLVAAVKEAVLKHWYLGLQKQRDYHTTMELKLGGCPWWADSNDAVESRYFISTLIGLLKVNGWQVCGTMDLTRRNNDKTTFVLRQCVAKIQPHMCISLNKTNRIRLIVSSTDISEEAELRLTSRLNETIKNYWVALGPRNYGKSIEWKLEGDPWVAEGLYSDSTRGVYLLCLILQAISPLGWRVAASADVASKNLDSNERYSYEGLSEDMHSWFFLYDEKLEARHQETNVQGGLPGKDLCSSTSVPNLEVERSEENLYYGELPTRPVSTSLQSHAELSRSVPGIPAAAAGQAAQPPVKQGGKSWALRSLSGSSLSTFRARGGGGSGGGDNRHCYATRHHHSGDGRRNNYKQANSANNNNNNNKIDGYKSDGYKSDGDGYKSDGAGYKSDGEHVKRRLGGGSGRYGGSPMRQPSKYEQDRLASRRLQPANGEQNKAQMRTGGGGDCCVGGGREMMSSLGRGGGGSGGETGTSRCSSRGGYRSDPEHEIEIQLQCLGGGSGGGGGGGSSQQDDSGGSQHSHRGYSLDEEEEDNRSGRGGPTASGGGGLSAAEWQRSELHQRTIEATVESRSQSRNGYKSDGSLQESPLHPQGGKAGTDMVLHSGYSTNSNSSSGRGGGGMRRSGLMQGHSASQLNTSANHQHMQQHYGSVSQVGGGQQQQQHRLLIHPTKHLEASRSFHTFQRQESTTSFHSTHSAPNPPPHQPHHHHHHHHHQQQQQQQLQLHQHHHHSQSLMVNNLESASTHSSSSSASAGPPDYSAVIHPPPTYDQALIKLDIAMRRRAAGNSNNNKRGQQPLPPKGGNGGAGGGGGGAGPYNSLHYVGEFYG